MGCKLGMREGMRKGSNIERGAKGSGRFSWEAV